MENKELQKLVYDLMFEDKGVLHSIKKLNLYYSKIQDLDDFNEFIDALKYEVIVWHKTKSISPDRVKLNDERINSIEQWIEEKRKQFFYSRTLVDLTNDDLPDIDLKTMKDQIRLLYELGVINYLIERYPKTLKSNNSQLSKLLSTILKENYSSLQPTVNALMNDNPFNKNYPKDSSQIRTLISHLNSKELD